MNPHAKPQREGVLLGRSLTRRINLHVQLQAATLLLYWQRFAAIVALEHRPLGGFICLLFKWLPAAVWARSSWSPGSSQPPPVPGYVD